MIDSFLEAYEVDSTHIKSLYQLANSYYKLKDKDSTSLFLEKGLELEPYHMNLNKLKVMKPIDIRSIILRFKFYKSLIP